jgi:hypothetical protein
MALGIKKVKLPDNAAEEPIVEDVPDESAADTVVPESSMDPVQDAADDTMLGALAEAPDAAADPRTTEAAGTDGLLDMFTTVGVHHVDRSMILSLAGEVEMDDLISELGIVAAALGIVTSERPAVARTEQFATAA